MKVRIMKIYPVSLFLMQDGEKAGKECEGVK